jgi:hypothetical protein
MAEIIAGDCITNISRRCSDETSLRVDLPLGDLTGGKRIIDGTLIDVPSQSVVADYSVGKESTEISADERRSGHSSSEVGGSRLAEPLVNAEDEGFFLLLINAWYV